MLENVGCVKGQNKEALSQSIADEFLGWPVMPNLFASDGIETSMRPGRVSPEELRSSGSAVKPRDSATLVLIRRDQSSPQILMGKRSPRHKFMPNKFVFPGGLVDPADARIKPNYDLHPAVRKRLMQSSTEARARALALAAVRETYEETGLVVGEQVSPLIKSRSRSWSRFLKCGLNPRLDTLFYIARAITPPYRNRRYDTRFFMADVDPTHNQLNQSYRASDELLDIHWVTLAQARGLDLPQITRVVLDEIALRLSVGQTVDQSGPFIYFRQGKVIRDTQ